MSARPATSGWIALALLLAAGIAGVIAYTTAVSPERGKRRVLALPFQASVSDVSSGFSEGPNGRVEFVDRVADWVVVDTASHVIVDIGDVRLALASPARISELLTTGRASGSVTIDSNQPTDLDGLGSGGGAGGSRGRFEAYRQQGVTTCTLEYLKFTIQKGEIRLTGAQVPVGRGKKVVFLRAGGAVESVIDLEAGATR
jgi:hypothetical protein